MANESILSQPAQPLLRRGLVKATAGLLACASLAGLGDPMPAAAHHNSIAQYSLHSLSPNLPTPMDLAECAVVDPEAMTAAEALVNQPENPLIEKVDQAMQAKEQADVTAILNKEFLPGGLLLHTTALGDTVTDEIYSDYNKNHAMQDNDTTAYTIDATVAEETGVTTYDPRPYTAALEEDIENNQDPQLPFAAYLNAARGYLSLYGISLDVATPGQRLAYGMVSPTVADTNTPTAKMDLFDLIEGVSTLPQQYMDLANVHEITLGANQPDRPSSVDAYANLTPEGSIVFNLSTVEGPSAIRHETGHRLDGATCGGVYAMYNDPTYNAHNHGQAYSGESATYPSVQSFAGTPDVSQLYKQEVKGMNAADLKPIQAKIDRMRSEVTYLTNYAETNIVEDKAEEAAAVTSDNWVNAFSVSTPIVRDKSLEVLSRIEQYNPGLASYFAQTASKNSYK